MTFAELALASLLAITPLGSVDSMGPSPLLGDPVPPAALEWLADAPVADTLPGMMDGRREAGDFSTRGSFLRGIGWGTVLGPAGGIVAMRREAGREVLPPESSLQSLGGNPPAYREGFLVGWQSENLEKRKEASVLGSMVGTIAFLGILFTLMDLGQTDQSVLPPEEDPGARMGLPGAGGLPVLSFPFAVGGR